MLASNVERVQSTPNKTKSGYHKLFVFIGQFIVHDSAYTTSNIGIMQIIEALENCFSLSIAIVSCYHTLLYIHFVLRMNLLVYSSLLHM